LGKGKIIQKEYLKLRKEQIFVTYLCIVSSQGLRQDLYRTNKKTFRDSY